MMGGNGGDAQGIEQGMVINKSKQKKRERVSTAEFFTALEGLLPAAEIEIDWLGRFVEDFPEDEGHAEDAELVRQGREAIELAKRLIARKTGNICRKQRALRERQGQAHA
jgi:hypothetical protein